MLMSNPTARQAPKRMNPFFCDSQTAREGGKPSLLIKLLTQSLKKLHSIRSIHSFHSLPFLSPSEFLEDTISDTVTIIDIVYTSVWP